MRQYKVALPLMVHTTEGSYGQGETFEKDFGPDEERENVESGLLEIVPCEYKVIGESKVYGTDPGDTFTAALLLGNEQQLLEGGLIEKVEPVEPAAAPAKPRKKKEEAN